MTNYWKKRQQQLNKALETSEREVRRRLYRVYKAEALRLQHQIDGYYARYGVNGVLRYRDMKRKLTAAEADLLYRDVYAFQRLHPECPIEIVTSIYELDRLEGLQTSVLLQSAELGLVEEAEVRAHLESMAALGANETAEALGRGLYTERSDIIQTIVNKKWSNGENFSGRIWTNREKLARTLNTQIAQSLARGDARAKIVRNVSKRFQDVSIKNIDRLVYTEGTYIMNESQAAVLEDTFTYYKLAPINDNKTCPFCHDVEDETEALPVKFEEREPGVNFPPLHPWCRCTFDIIIPDRMEFMRNYTGINVEDFIDEA